MKQAADSERVEKEKAHVLQEPWTMQYYAW
jgi:hypothetical protein